MRDDPLLERLIRHHRPAPPWRYEPKSFNRRITGTLGLEPWQNAVIYNPTPRDIMKAVANYYEIPIGYLTTRFRGRKFDRARLVAMFLCRNLTRLSNTEIGIQLERDRTCITHAHQKITELKETDAALDRDIWNLRSMFGRLN